MKKYHKFIFCILALLSFAQKAYAENDQDMCKEKTYEKLYSGMESGSFESLVDFIRCIDNFDGGNLGDLYIQAGLFLERDPFLYGYILENENILEFPSFDSFFVMLPSKFVDDDVGRLNEIEKRIKLVSFIRDERIRVFSTEELQESKDRISNAAP